ncbi:MAG: CoA pyrophosphatase [Anaerolineae bacterium]
MTTPPTLSDVMQLQQALQGPLPGEAAQRQMAPAAIHNGPNRWETPADCRKAGVLILLYPHATLNPRPEPHLVLIRRPDYGGVHSGQIALPGGRREPGESLQATALREAQEEVGINPREVTVLGQLSPLYTPPSNFCIYPFVALSSEKPAFKPDNREVAELIEAPLRLFLDPAVRREEIWHLGNYGERRVPFFHIFNHKIWGATAMILSEFLLVLTER